MWLVKLLVYMYLSSYGFVFQNCPGRFLNK